MTETSERRGPLPPSVAEATERLSRGHGVVLLVSNGDRTARRRHLDALDEEARRRGIGRFRIEATAFDTQVPFGAIEPWLSRLATRGARRAPPESGEVPLPLVALAGLLGPGLEADRPSSAGAPEPPGKEGRAPTPPGADTFPEEHALGYPPEEVRSALVDLVEHHARSGPTLLFVDGAGRLDSASRAWMLSLMERIQEFPLGFALSFDREDDPFLAQCRSPERRALWDRVAPEGATSSEPSPRELARLLRGLPEGTLRALRVVKLAGPDTEEEILDRALELGKGGARKALSEAEGAGLCRWVRTRCELVEPLPLEEGSPLAPSPTEDPPLHRALARAIERRTPTLSGKVLFRVAEHWDRAKVLEPGVLRLLAAARESERWGAEELADAWYRRALLLAQSDPSPAARETEERVLYQLAGLRRRSGDYAGEVEMIRRATALAEGRRAGVQQIAHYVARWAVAITHIGGDPEDLLRSTLEKVRGRFPLEEARLMVSYAVFLGIRGRGEEALTAALHASEIAESTTDVMLRVQCLRHIAVLRIFGGGEPEKAREPLERALALADALRGGPEQDTIVDLKDHLAQLELDLGNLPEAVRRGEEALELARRLGTRASILFVLGNLSEIHALAGHAARASVLNSELRRSLARYQVPTTDEFHLQLLLSEALTYEEEGDRSRALERLSELAQYAEKGGTRYYLAQALAWEMVLAERGGDGAGARRALRRIEKDGLVKALGSMNRKRVSEAKARLEGPKEGASQRGPRDA